MNFDFESMRKTVRINVQVQGDMRAGTPISSAGFASNNSSAIGILPHAIRMYDTKIDAYGNRFAQVDVIVGGYVDLKTAQAESGITYTSDAKNAMSGIVFVDGNLPQPEIPKAATKTTLGLVKKAENVPEAEGEAPTAAEFKALLDALIAAGIMAAPEAGG